ncbi:glutamine-hydrolyzing carbamoyl-phosphate synthase small subunit [Thermosediminibacter litoriperuensis]|uniref:Carbamoyl phosphate synthase small chain n=1 Tax=Thermosediminibacter litoriperuensis TaxID=291989 RepID=A0A5S5AN40_9FIRM|nr:glutamine-hydrolyzing carbamoyl-phosphate synthase small subunit [Thermosediminibacter litoriperuensis]TYP52479.1 carbamoyl-phosphate synthase small subunit [Thermosediminibacter litoriperuensis]
MKAILVLEDGSAFEGKALGASGTAWGELVFNTGMTGYQEVITDPSYAGQIVILTYPLIGNYGTRDAFSESQKPVLRGVVVREACERPPAGDDGNLDDYLKRCCIVGIERVDTRLLTKKIRSCGVMKAVLSTELDVRDAREMLRRQPELGSQDLVKQVTSKGVRVYGEENGIPVALMDFGVKHNILRCLVRRRCRVTVFPADAPAGSVLESRPAGVLLSNGPGDPKKAGYAVNTVRELLGKVPVFGICLGHQIMALALGGDTYKLRFGHRGSNHPVRDLKNGRVFITSQNHGYAVDGASLEKGVEVTFVNANDGTVEGLEVPKFRAFSVQFHPEASPGPGDTEYLFDEFLKLAGGEVRRCRRILQ